jgi:hypothetical protein
MPLDRQRSDLNSADFEAKIGRLTLVGDLTLDFVNVRCIAEIDLSSLSGQGRWEPLDTAAEMS